MSSHAGLFTRPDGFAFAWKLHGASLLDSHSAQRFSELQNQKAKVPAKGELVGGESGEGKDAGGKQKEKRNARPLVMINGLSATMAEFWPIADRIGDERPVLIFDNRGMGGSTAPKDWDYEFELQDLANDVAELVKHFGWKEIDLLGFSMGGMIAQTLLLTPNLPFKIRHAVLTATSAKNPRSELLSVMPEPRDDRDKMSDEEKMKELEPLFEKQYDPKWIANPENSEMYRRRLGDSIKDKRPARVVMAQAMAVSQYDIRKRLPGIPSSLPVLVVHGTEDKSVFFSERRYILDNIKHAKIAATPVDAFGHMWYDYFSPAFWVRTIGDFLDDQGVEGYQKAKL